MPSIALPVSLRGQLLSGVRSAVAVFSPADLFATGSQGIWLDPSDLSTMYSDRAGTTPVTTPGTVVGLRLDKSKGLVLGPEQSPAFSLYDTVLTGTWAASGANYVFTDTAGGQSRPGVQWPSISLVAGWYQIVVVVAAINGATQVRVDGIGATDQLFVVGTNTRIINVTSTSRPRFRLEDLSTTIGDSFTITSVSVRELAGNHAVAPTDAARPIYGVEPKGGRRNLLTFTHDLTNTTNWPNGPVLLGSRSGAGVSVSDPEGYAYISRTAASNTVVSGVTYTASVTVVCDQTISNVPIRFGSGYGVSQFALVNMVVGVPQRVNLTATATGSGPISAEFGIDARNGVVPGGSNATGYTVTFSDPQLELGSTATNYQRVSTAYDITESGVATCHYVQYDGSDDSMSTSAIDFTATDKMSVFAGVRKLSDAAAGVVAELSSTSATNNGVVALFAPGAAASNYSFRSKGTADSLATATTFTAPITNVVTGIGDISGDTSKLRVNGTQVAQDTTDQGTGNYGNWPLFIGRRNNATLPFNGRDYGLIVVGKAASAGEITDTELWLSDKTSEVDVAKSISPNIYTRSGDTILDRANSIIERRTV